MPRPITKRQLKYLNILLSKAFGGYRKIYLKEFCEVDSSKDLTLLEASEQIEKFVPDNPEREKNIAEAKEKILKSVGQGVLFD